MAGIPDSGRVLAPLSSHTTAENPAGRQFEKKPTPKPGGRHPPSQPARPSQRYGNTATPTHILNQAPTGQYSRSFDAVFEAEGMSPITTPPRAPMANAYAERWVRTLRHELLDRTIIWNERQLRALLVDYIDHYNHHRPHRALNHAAPDTANVVTISSARPILRHARCGGLINEYRHAA